MKNLAKNLAIPSQKRFLNCFSQNITLHTGFDKGVFSC